MKYEKLLASRYIKAQKRQSVFTVISIAAAISVMTMIFVIYGVFMDCYKNTVYRSAPYHLAIVDLTEEQGEALKNEDHIRNLKLHKTDSKKVTATILFEDDPGDEVLWLQTALSHINASSHYPDKKFMWNEKLLNLDSIGYGAHLFKLRIFSIFFIFAMFFAFALRLVIDTAFEISSKERERHYGVLQSVGASPEQIVRIITSEGMQLCVIAIPFGLTAGVCFAYLIYKLLLRSGLSDLFQSMTDAEMELPFTVHPLMLLISAVVGSLWVFFSAYGVGMRIIKKSPMEAIITRADEVKKVRKHTLSGLIFGISGSIASRNARRQKKRFFITVLTLTVSILLFTVFTTLPQTVENSINKYINGMTSDYDFVVDINDITNGVTYESVIEELEGSGLFRDISQRRIEEVNICDPTNQHYGSEFNCYAEYVNREGYKRLFGDNVPVSYDELAEKGGYIINTSGDHYNSIEPYINKDNITFSSKRIILSDEMLAELEESESPDLVYIYINAERERCEHTVSVIGKASARTFPNDIHGVLIGASETFNAVKDEYYGNFNLYGALYFSYYKDGEYTAKDYKEIREWLDEHFTGDISIEQDGYYTKVLTHNIISAVRAGMLFFNVMIALIALINLLNIISTGIANRRSEMASLQCIGMTDIQLDKMVITECMQFTFTAAIISAILCAVFVFGTEGILTYLINQTFVEESEGERQMIMDLFQLDHVKPFLFILAASMAAFAAGCITSLIMVRAQRSESLSDQIRGSEMELDTRKSHILRNSVIAVLGAFVLTVAGLRIYSVVSYHNDRKEYEKAGYLNLVDSNGFKMNVYSTGAENGKHTIVGIAGHGVNCFPILTAELNERLGKENTLVYPDRAGYGFSDDSSKNQSLQQVVEDYRTGLKNAGFEAPYVLMPHSYGSYYALWWQANYPDEVEAIIFLDSTWLTKGECWEDFEIESYPSEKAAKADMRRYRMRTWLGLDRLIYKKEQDEQDKSYGRSVLNKEQVALMELTKNRAWSSAGLSEILNEIESVRELYEIVKPTDTPKIYFTTMPSCMEDILEVLEFQKADYEAAGMEFRLIPEKAAKAEWKRDGGYYKDIYENTLTPFIEKCGNCRLVSIGGEHAIFYAQKAQQTADMILDFLAEMDE